MCYRNDSHLTRCYRTTAGILISGFTVSLVIFLLAEDAPYNPFAEFEGSKKFAYELQRIGGKGAVVANELTSWFSGLWHGRQLAFTAACITALIALGYYLVASGNEPTQQDENKKRDDS